MKSGWKIWWDAQSSRIDALSLRERGLFFLSIIIVCIALADRVWLSPAQLIHKQLAQTFEKQNTELQHARSELQAIAKPVGASPSTQDEIKAVNVALDTVNQAIKDALPSASQEISLTEVLVHLLHRNERLTLLRISAVATETADVGIQTARSSVNALPVGLMRRGVEFTVSGPYPDLTRYVQTLETLLPSVRWGAMKLKSEKLPPELTLQLFLIRVQP